jgi:mitotic spindle assembly checkpoint protein MAD1
VLPNNPHARRGVDIPSSDPQFSAAKRQQRTSAFTSSMAHASLERQLLQARSEKVELEAKLRERDSTIERLESDRRLLALREQSEKEEKEQEQTAREKDKVRQLVTIGHVI